MEWTLEESGNLKVPEGCTLEGVDHVILATTRGSSRIEQGWPELVLNSVSEAIARTIQWRRGYGSGMEGVERHVEAN